VPLAITVTLVSGADTATFRALPPSTEAPVSVPGVIHRSAGGALVHYKVGAAYHEVVLQVQHMTNAQKDTLESFFRTHWRDAITYTDENGNAFAACKIMEGSLALRKDYKNSWHCSLRMQLPSVLK